MTKLENRIIAPFHMERREFVDDRTGRTVWQVTDGEFECVAPYMEIQSWTDDDRFLIFMSNRTGTWQPYRLEVATGETTQLYETVGAQFRSIALDPLHNEVYCESDNGFVAVDFNTLEARRAADLTRYFDAGLPHGKGHAAALNHDGSLLTFLYRGQDERGHAVVVPTNGSNEFIDYTIPHESMTFEYSHVQFCSTDDNIIVVSAWPDWQNDRNETPERRAHAFAFHRDTGKLTILALVSPGFRAIHSVWGRSGERFYFHRKSVPGWVPTALCSVNRAGEDLRVYYETSDHRLGHCSASPDEKWLVSDSQDFDENILMLVHLERPETHMLCWPNNSIASERPHTRLPHLPPHTDRHTHPGFSRTGQYIHYTSDISGRSQVYVVPVGDLVT